MSESGAFLECPNCGAALVEDQEGASEFAYRCDSCGHSFLYEEGTLIDYGKRDDPAPPPGD